MPQLEIAKLSILSKDKNQPEEVEVPDYTDEEKTYISNLQKRLTDALEQRNGEHDEFDGMDYISYWRANERIANTYLEAKKEEAEPDWRSGTIRTKMFAFLNSFQALNLNPDISAFDRNQILIQGLGDAMEDVIEKNKELDNDDEKKVLRQYELLKQGSVFVEKEWFEQWVVQKDIKKGFFGDIKGVEWETEKKRTDGRIRSTIIAGPGVYLGNIRKYFIEDQPYIFTVEVDDYQNTEKIYGEWERWKYVSKDKRTFDGTVELQMVNNAWRLLDSIKKNRCEIIKYQDKPNNEFQIIINGVPMIPMGYPLSAVSPGGEYTITQQNLEPMSHRFAYGKSFVFKNKNLVAILDTAMKLGILNLYRSLMPPLANMGERTINKKVLMPGQISRGIRKGDLVPVYEGADKGTSQSELAVIQLIRDFVNENTTSPTFTGAKEKGGDVTATQILELQRQARLMMALLMFAASQLEKKLAWKDLPLILENWFDPIDTQADLARNVLRQKYRITARSKMISGKGQGMRMVIPTEEAIPSSKEIRKIEEETGKRVGMPVKMIVVNPKMLKEMKVTWVINVTPKEKRTSEVSKMLFGSMMRDALALGIMPNIQWIQERFAQVWEEDPSKMFGGGQTPPQGLQATQRGQGGQQPKTGAEVKQPKIAPTAEQGVPQPQGVR